jgi:hypothetical protein
MWRPLLEWPQVVRLYLGMGRLRKELVVQAGALI